MAEDKIKDLTGILEFSKDQEKKGHAPPAPAGSVMEEQAIEKIDSFESLESYAEANPDLIPPLEADQSPEPDLDFPVSPENSPPFQEEQIQEQPQENFQETTPETTDFPVTDSEENAGSPFSLDLGSFTPNEDPSPSNQADLADLADQTNQADQVDEPFSAPEEPVAPAAAAAPPPPSSKPKSSTPPKTIQLQPPELVPAALPFSVLIEGTLLPQDQEKLLDVISRENMGIRELDLEPQLAQGRVLIPRISEYAAIVLVQALRGIQAKIRMGLSDEIFISSDTRETLSTQTIQDEQQAKIAQKNESRSQFLESMSSAEQIPVSSEIISPEYDSYRLIDNVIATAILKTQAVEVEKSPEYQSMIDTLKRELQYKAYRKGASVIVHFKIQLNLLSSPTQYRLTAMGSAMGKLPGRQNRDRENPNTLT